MSAPDKIWLQWYGDSSPDQGEPTNSHGDVTWCADNIFEHDVEYVMKKSEWQPIETAPKDAIIDLWHKEYGRMTDAWWAAESWSSTGTGDEDFSHWMPIPAAP